MAVWFAKGALFGALLLGAAAPHAGVRVQFEGPDGLRETVLVSGTTHASATLPGALALPRAVPVTPTWVPLAAVSPTMNPAHAASSTVQVVPVEGVSPTAVHVVRSNAMRGACLQSLELLMELGMLASTRSQHAAYMQLVAAAGVLQTAVEAGQPGDWRPVGRALRRLPWRGPLREEIGQAGDYALGLCRPQHGWGTEDGTAEVFWPQ